VLFPIPEKHQFWTGFRPTTAIIYLTTAL